MSWMPSQRLDMIEKGRFEEMQRQRLQNKETEMVRKIKHEYDFLCLYRFYASFI